MITETVYLHFLNAISEGNKKECINIVEDQLNNNTGIKDIYTKLIQRSMYKIGNDWEKNRTSVAAEHIATNISASLLSIIYPQIIKTEKNGRKIVMTCIDKEFHELGARIISDYFEYKGWESIYLGANTPQNEIIEIIDLKEPELVGISCNFYMNILRLLKLINELNSKFPKQKIIIGGQAINHDNIEMFTKFKNVTVISDLENVDKYLKKNFKN